MQGQHTQKRKGVLVLSLCCLVEKPSCEHWKNHAYYAFNVIWRKHLAGWVVGGQDGIGKQKCSDSYDYYPYDEIIGFHRQPLLPHGHIVLCAHLVKERDFPVGKFCGCFASFLKEGASQTGWTREAVKGDGSGCL
jgi:hypothetical protein